MQNSVRMQRAYNQTIPLGVEDAIAHVDGCRGQLVAGACGGLYVCNSCERTIGRCHSQPDMPAVCVLCRARYLCAWGRVDSRKTSRRT